MPADRTPEAPQRKYTLTKIAPGDYILPSSDGKTIWRITAYVDGESSGLPFPDKTFWACWKWTMRPDQLADRYDEWDLWGFSEGTHETRRAAIDAAMRAGS